MRCRELLEYLGTMEKKTTKAVEWIIGILNKHNIPYQIAGGFAAKLYGSERKLHDIDIPDKDFPIILPEISQYIIYGPDRYVDGKWDCYLITLDYNGQEIDICGADTLRINNKARTEWLEWPTAFNTLDMIVEGVLVKVLHPQELIKYKKELDGEHQEIDIDAAEKYLLKHTKASVSQQKYS